MHFAVQWVWMVLLLALPSAVKPQNQNELAARADKEIWFLGPGSFEDRTKEGIWLIYFGTTWCPYCKVLTPRWLEVQKTVEAENLAQQMFSMAKVDCTSVGQFCANLRVTGYPNIFLFQDGNFVEQYYQQHETSVILSFIREKLRMYTEYRNKLNPPPALNDAQERSGKAEVRDNGPVAPPNQPQPPPRAPNTAAANMNNQDQNPAPVISAPQIPQENAPLNKKKIQPPPTSPTQAPGPTVQPSQGVPKMQLKMEDDQVDDGYRNTTVKGTKKHPIKEFRGFRGFLQSRIVSPLVGPECSTSLLQFKFFSHFDCTRLLISKVLGIGLVAGGAVIKLPQIYKIVMKRSALGVSFSSYALETAAYIAGLAYNVRQGNPFNTYGEHAFMAVANCIVIGMMFHYTHRYNELAIVGVGTTIFTVSLFTKSIINDTILLSLQWVAILIGIVSKLPQIHSNWIHKSCGQLSAVTVGLQTVGSLARCFTTATEVKDTVIFVTYLVATALNGTVLYQVVLYWGKGRKSKSLMD